MIRLDAATVLLQWAVGGLFFLWITTRRREVGLGYGWLLRGGFWVMAAAGVPYAPPAAAPFHAKRGLGVVDRACAAPPMTGGGALLH